MPTVVPFPAGIKAYLEDPRRIFDTPLPTCTACGGSSGWVVNAACARWTSDAGIWFHTTVFQTRCRACHATTRMLPDFMLPYVQHGLPTIRSACETYVETTATYRKTALAISHLTLPEGENLSSFWGSYLAPSPTPSSIFRWVDRFSRGADDWWPLMAAETQARDTCAIRPPRAPEHLPAKARSESKRNALKIAWQLLWLLRLLLGLLGMIPTDWPRLLHFAPLKPSKVDRTGWFVQHTLVPP